MSGNEHCYEKVQVVYSWKEISEPLAGIDPTTFQ